MRLPAEAMDLACASGESRRVASMASARLLHRAARGDSLSEDEIVTLFEARGDELHTLLQAADRLRRETCGDTVTYVINRNINYTNICALPMRLLRLLQGTQLARSARAGLPPGVSRRSRAAPSRRALPVRRRSACKAASIPPTPGRPI